MLLVTMAFVFTGGFSKSNYRTPIETITIQGLKQSNPPKSAISINETQSLNITNSYSINSSGPVNIIPVLSDTSPPKSNNYPDMTGFFFLPQDNTHQGEIIGSENNPSANITANNATVPISLDASQFVTYTYGDYPIQQPNSTQFVFSFPDNISQGQIAGSDALTGNSYAIQKIDFDAIFTAPNINAFGFDEIVIFATSNTANYKGTEFGIRLDLQDGVIYGYIQEPNGNFGEINFEMQKLMPNDGIMHHYTLIMLGSAVIFCIDGTECGYLNFPSNIDYSSLGFSICAVVHRFTNGWDSSGDNMIVGNFVLNQQ